jgi:hypothetical protein
MLLVSCGEILGKFTLREAGNISKKLKNNPNFFKDLLLQGICLWDAGWTAPSPACAVSIDVLKCHSVHFAAMQQGHDGGFLISRHPRSLYSRHGRSGDLA